MGNNSSGTVGKRKAKDRMGTVYAEDDEEKENSMQEATRLAKDRKAHRIWLMQPDP
jgi:hypothetical protein